MEFKTKTNGGRENSVRLTDVLNQNRLVHTSPGSEGLSLRIEKCQAEKRPFRMLYGETFDGKGNPLDSLKYYLFVSALSKAIKSSYQVDVESTILVADLGVYRNYPEEVQEYKKYAASREAFARKVKEVYKCSYDVRLMSEISDTPEFRQRFGRVSEISNLDAELMGMIRKSVPEDRLEAEAKRGYKYPFEEIATILGLDVKVGPPREQLYDDIANSMLPHFNVSPLLPIYLTPTYPVGTNFAAYTSSPATKQYGLTPYKVGSSGMTAHRIVLGVTSVQEAKRLIDETQISSSATKPNPVCDILVLADLARQHLEGEFVQKDVADTLELYYRNRIRSHQIKETAFTHLRDHVLNYFG